VQILPKLEILPTKMYDITHETYQNDMVDFIVS
jgi:hypothetical protein